jgi:collagen type VII alpha
MPEFDGALLRAADDAMLVNLAKAEGSQIRGLGIFESINGSTPNRDGLSSNNRCDGYIAVVKSEDKVYLFNGNPATEWTNSANWSEVGSGAGATGATGVAGDIGATGAGATGATGIAGDVGATGVIGTTGATGVRGITGFDGATGATGVDGSDGDIYTTTSSTSINISTLSLGQTINLTVGTSLAYSTNQSIIVANSSANSVEGTVNSYDSANGNMPFTVIKIKGSGTYTSWDVSLAGAPGADGNDGATGATGVGGDTGATGATGAAGATGVGGPTGATGADSNVAGPIGATGLAGSEGATGATGVAGDTGSTGATGVAGGIGATGLEGPTGATGLAGDEGATGVAGDEGATGVAGDEGATGATGVAGPTGATGADSNVAGPTGPDGPTGATGVVGSVQGANEDGTTGVVADPTFFKFDKFDVAATGIGGALISQEKFTQDHVANMPTVNNVVKTFGKYQNGATIPTNGKTALEVLLDAIQDVVDPEATLTGFNSPAYGRGNFTDTVTLNFGVKNNTTTSGTVGVSATLEWGVNGYGAANGGGTQAYSNTQVYFGASSINQSITFTTSYDASNEYQVRLTVTEPGTNGDVVTEGVQNSSGTTNWDTTISTMAFTGTTGLTTTAGLSETSTRRIRGNTSTTFDVDISSDEPSYVDIATIKIYGHAGTSDSFPESDLLTTIAVSGSSYDNDTAYTHDPGDVASYRYRTVVTDEHGLTSTDTESGINYYYETYFGLSTDSAFDAANTIDDLSAELFTSVPGGIDGIGPFNNSGGSTYVWIAYPSITDITQISDGAEIITTGFTQQADATITGLNGESTTYSVYRSDAAGSFDNVTLYLT